MAKLILIAKAKLVTIRINCCIVVLTVAYLGIYNYLFTNLAFGMSLRWDGSKGMEGDI